MLGRLEMTIAECETAYLTLSKEVFGGGSTSDTSEGATDAAIDGAKYNGKILISGFKTIIEQQLGAGSADAPMYDPTNPNPKCKV